MTDYRQFLLPDAGEGLTEAEIVAWHVKEGDQVTVNQTIVEIETAKSLVELPVPWTGVVSAILAPEGTTVEVGAPIIEIAVPDDAPQSSGPAPAAAPVAEAAPAAAAEQADAETVETAVADPAAQTVPVVESAAEPATETVAPSAPAEPEPSSDEKSGAVLVGYGVQEVASRRTSAPRRALTKPPVRALAREMGVDINSVVPTGPGGIVTREDVLAHASAAEARDLVSYPGDEPWLDSGTVSYDGRQTRVPVKSVRKRTAEAMVSSAFSAPHVTVFHTVDVTKTMKLVARLKADREFADVRVTPLLIAAKALLLAVNRHPEINASWDDDSQEIVYKHYVNLGIAAATPRGLVVPNIKDAHRLGLRDLAGALGDLTQTARSGKVTPTEMADGTITITNVGVFGIDTGTPILNPGEAAILAFGAVRPQPWVHRGKIKVRQVTQLALSFDHRLVDGELGSRVLADVAAVLADPSQGLVWG